MNVAQVEVCRINENAIAFFSGDFEAPQRRLCKCISHCQTLVGVIARGAEIVVRRNQQNAWPSAIETDNRAVAELTAIETDVV